MKSWGLFLASMTLTEFMLLKFSCFDTVGVLFLSMCCAPALLLAAAEVTRKRKKGRKESWQEKQPTKNQC